MADYRTVKTSMWAQDEWFMDLPIDGKLLWMYLFTNSHTSVAGIYKLPLRTIAFESGIEPARVQRLLELFASADKAHFEDGIIWIVKMREHQASSSALVEKRIRLDVDALPDTPLKRKYCRKYGIDMVSIGYLENDLETETDTEIDIETEIEPTQAQATLVATSNGTPKKRKGNPDKEHPCVQAYRDLHNRWPQAAQMRLIVEHDPPVADFVRALRAWAAKGYSPNNIGGVLDWVENPTKMNKATGANGHYQNGKYVPDDDDLPTYMKMAAL